MKYKVLGPRILLKVPKLNKYYPGTSIEIPDEHKEQHTTQQTLAEVVQIGAGALTNPDFGLPETDLKIGDKVHFARYGAVRLKSLEHETDEFWIINAKDLLCIEVEDNA